MKFLILLLLFGCNGKPKEQTTPEPLARLSELQDLYAEKMAEAVALRDPETGWLARNDCDGMIWAGKYAASRGVTGVNILAAEYPDSPGKFGRRPPPWCWDGKDNGSKTEWSRDMAVGGLLPYAFLTGRIEVLERHAAYGRAHHWLMGEPLLDGRAVYTPSLKGLLYKTIDALGGTPDVEAFWPDSWPSGLTDYEAHLQVMSIWLHGETARRLGDSDQIPQRIAEKTTALQISETMFDRLQEHVDREPMNPLYRAVYGLYDGDMGAAADVLLDPSMPLGSYVRCNDLRQCRVAEWLFAASIVLDKVTP